ncbi:MAG: sodium/solute symporter [Myxococcota bacterium]
MDTIAFVSYIAVVVVVSLTASRQKEHTEGYFLAGRNLSWWLIGLSLIASNISTEHLVGMSGKGFELGLAIASFEWIAAVALVPVALVLLPRFLERRIYTLPEYLEWRYNSTARAIMAFYLMVLYVLAAMAGILYTGGLALEGIFGVNLYYGVWGIGLLTGAYTVYGGLKAVVWSDLIQGLTLLAGGTLVFVLGLDKVGGFSNFLAVNADKLHMVLPLDHAEMPWSIFALGIWIPNICYWGLNQFITQRALAAKDLAAGQRGILFAAFLKLWIPFIAVLPGIMAHQLYGEEIANGDHAYAYFVQELLPPGLHGIMFAALLGAVMSSLDSMLNSASTIFTIDLYGRYLAGAHATDKDLVRVGRWATASFVTIACLVAPELRHMGPIYDYMQSAWNFIWPGTLAVFAMGILSKKTTASAAVLGLIASVPLYGVFLAILEGQYLNASALAALCTFILVIVTSHVFPVPPKEPVPPEEEVQSQSEFKEFFVGSPSIKLAGLVIIMCTTSLYIFFW